METQVFAEIERLKEYVERLSSDIGWKEEFEGDLNELKEGFRLLSCWFERDVCAKEIREAVYYICNQLNNLIDYNQRMTAQERLSVAQLTKNHLSVFYIGESLHTEGHQPTAEEVSAESKSLDELLSFVPAEHQESAKHAFERLLHDGTIKRFENKFEWLKAPKIVLMGYFAYKGNVDWKMKDGRGYSWKPFADLFGVKASSLKDWYNQSELGNGTRRLNNNCKYIDNIFAQAKEKFP